MIALPPSAWETDVFLEVLPWVPDRVGTPSERAVSAAHSENDPGAYTTFGLGGPRIIKT